MTAKTINLEQVANDASTGVPFNYSDEKTHIAFRVVSLRNSVDYTIRQYLSRDEVADLCDFEAWTVKIGKAT